MLGRNLAPFEFPPPALRPSSRVRVAQRIIEQRFELAQAEVARYQRMSDSECLGCMAASESARGSESFRVVQVRVTRLGVMLTDLDMDPWSDPSRC